MDINYLRNYHVFKDLIDKELKQVNEIIRLESYSKGVKIIKDGDKGGTVFLLLDGEVEITKSMTLLKSKFGEFDYADKALIRLKKEWYPCVGEMVLFGDDSARSATVTTTMDSKFGVIEKDDFLDLARKNNTIGYKVMRNLAQVMGERLKKANQDILKLTTAFTLVLES